MLNPRAYYNSRADGFGVLEVADPTPNAPRRFAPLKRTDLAGTVTGPLATLALTQTFALPGSLGTVVEALYRFPLPGDAAVTGVRVRFGSVEVHTTLKERGKAEEEYREAKRTGRQAALLTRESPDVFTLAVAGIRAGEDVVVRTEYVQLGRREGAGWTLRVPLTTAPRYVRADEAGSRHAAGQPLAVLRDPGHRFALDLTFPDADQIASGTHALAVEGERVRLCDGEVVPDRDCVITWRPRAGDRPALGVWTHADAGGPHYFLALCAPPRYGNAKKVPREVILLVDHSGSMQGAKWEAADWAVERFLGGLGEHDVFALGLFHGTTRWFAERPRRATAGEVRRAVAFLKAHRDNGGTQLGVALEQALDRARAADTPARHVLVLTDGEVSDAGRVLRLADAEAAKPDRRRVSVLCIDSAPNEAMAAELARRGGGVSQFLTSNPDEDDVTTALDDVLADWSAPVLTGLTLEVNRAGAEAAGRTVALISPGPASEIDVGDLPAGRPVWVIGRVPAGGGRLAFRLRTGAEILAEIRTDASSLPGLKALFGADRVRRLEYLMHAHHTGGELSAELARLGYETASAGGKVYAENARGSATTVVRDLLVRESLAAGVACSETAFVAVRSEPGQPVTETQIVANALPHGWAGQFAGGTCGGGGMLFAARPRASRLIGAAPPSVPAAAVESVDSMLVEFDDRAGGPATKNAVPPSASRAKRRAALPPPSAAAGGPQGIISGVLGRLGSAFGLGGRADAGPSGGDIYISIAAGQHPTAHGAVLLDSATGDTGQFTFLSVAFADKTATADTLDPDLTMLLFAGDLAAPRARVKLADVLRQGGRRPLNLRRDAGQPVRLTLEDPAGAWRSGVPALEIVLGWKV